MDTMAPILALWRTYVTDRPGPGDDETAERTTRLTTSAEELAGTGLAGDEAFLVALRRLADTDPVARDFAHDHPDLWWPGPAVPGGVAQAASLSGGSPASLLLRRREGLLAAIVFAALAGLAVRVAFALEILPVAAVLGVAVVLGGYLLWLRGRVALAPAAGLLGAVAVFAAVEAFYPFAEQGQTQPLFWLHAPIVLWVVLGAVYLGADWRILDRWPDYLRFTGELFIHVVLFALGGGVLFGLAFAMFTLTGVYPGDVLGTWVLPISVGGAIVIAAWLVETGSSLSAMAPMLTRVFTPLVTLLLVAFLITVPLSGRLVEADRNTLIIVDALLAVVLGLVLFSLAARPVEATPGWFDRLQVVLIVGAVLVDVLVLLAIGGRIAEYGATANKLAALGENVVLAVNLVWAAWLQLGFLRGRRPYVALVRWQSRYLPVIGAWAAVVAVVFGPVFGFR